MSSIGTSTCKAENERMNRNEHQLVANYIVPQNNDLSNLVVLMKTEARGACSSQQDGTKHYDCVSVFVKKQASNALSAWGKEHAREHRPSAAALMSEYSSRNTALAALVWEDSASSHQSKTLGPSRSDQSNQDTVQINVTFWPFV